MLYIETQAGFSPWSGAPIGGVVYPLAIEQHWTTQELAAFNLYKPQDADPIPPGKRAVSTAVQRVGGVVKFVHTLEDVPPPAPSDQPLTKRQLRLGLLQNNILPSAIRAQLEAIPDPIQREVALTWFDFTDMIEWDHPQTQALMSAVGFTPEQAAHMWTEAWRITA
jgi:hypothetical protein